MGWKISCIIANERESGYLATSPELDCTASLNIIGKMEIPATHSSLLVFFSSGIDAIDGRHFCIGAYEGAALIVGIPDLVGTVEQENNKFIERFVSLYPKATVFAFDLNSVTNYFAYVLFEKSVLRRKACGDAERGLVLNQGALLEEETEVLDKYASQDLVKNGEELAFNICKRFFGCPFDEFDGEKLHVEIQSLIGPFFMSLRKLFRRPPFDR